MAHEFDKLFALKDEGKSTSEIAERCGMDRRRVKEILESLSSVKEYRPYSLTDDTKWPAIKERIEAMYRENKGVFTWQVINDIKERFHEQVGYYCVSQVRECADLHRKQRKYGHFVREPNRDIRVGWAKDRKDEQEMFMNVFFGDEASVEIENETGFVWVHSDDTYGHISMRPKHPQRVMIWLGISMMGATEIKVFGPKERLKSEDYCKVIEEFLLPTAKKLYGKRYRLAHDNARVHTSAHTTKALAEMGVEMVPWPAESPDMMPVELAFAYLKDRLRSHYKPKNKAELVDAIHKFKEDFLTKEYCRKTIRHIHSAMTQVIRREGFPVRGKKD